MSADCRLTLLYYPARGECDRVRIALALYDLEYKEINVSGKEAAIARSNAPFGLLPTLTDSGTVIAGSLPILLYLAEKYGPSLTREENAYANSICIACDEIQRILWSADFEEESIASDYAITQTKNKFMRDNIAPLLSLLAKDIKPSPMGPYLLGSKPTHADACLLSCLDALAREYPKLPVILAPLGLNMFWETISQEKHVQEATESGKRF